MFEIVCVEACLSLSWQHRLETGRYLSSCCLLYSLLDSLGPGQVRSGEVLFVGWFCQGSSQGPAVQKACLMQDQHAVW